MSRKTPTPTREARPRVRRNELALRLLQAQEEERRRIARMLHDDLGQTLTAAVLELEYAKAAADAAEVIDAVLVELRRLLGAARDLSLSLRPALIDEEGLEAALGALVSRLSAQRGKPVSLLCILPGKLPIEHALIAFRVVQEVITTLADPAARLSISVRADRVAVRLKVESDLPLWHAEGPPVIGTLDRVTMVGGTLRLQRTRAGGARVGVNLPLPATR